jgi:hypothetical protein
VTNNQVHISPLSEKIIQGIRKAVKKLVEDSAANNETLVIGDEEGKIKTVPARELLDSVQNDNDI